MLAIEGIVNTIDEEIRRLTEARSVLAPATPKRSYSPRRKARTISPEGRARIAAAMRKRWRAKKRASK